jgi:hypothetical protein
MEAMPYKPLVIDELHRRVHSHLTIKDECYYLMDYTSHVGYTFSEENSLISNFKKKLDTKGSPQWSHKEKAINIVAEILRPILANIVDFNSTTIVPIPPSKKVGDPLYDDRLIRVLQKATKNYPADIQSIIVTQSSVEASHTVSVRPPVSEIKKNYRFDEGLTKSVRNTILLFDDVLTSGAHYIACKEVIQAGFPDADIYGLFIARRVLLADDIHLISP